MLQEDRYLRIIEYLKNNSVATFEDISKLTGASIGTVRRDLSNLEENGMLKVVRGGATARKDDITKQAFDMRGIEHRNEKKELASLLGNIIIDGQAIGINSGTTNIEVANFLVENYNRLTVITNNLRLVDILNRGKNFNVIIPGGTFNSEEYAIFGRNCENQIMSYNFDVCILAVNAISDIKGITDFRIRECGIINAFINSSKTKAVVADNSKFDRIAYANVCGIDKVDCIFSDSGLTEEQINRYENKGVKIFTPKIGEFD